MANILFMAHRLPYPPNKGDKVRSYHLLRHLARQHQVYLGAFVDDEADWKHVPSLSQWCAEVKAVKLNPLAARVACLKGVITGEPLTLTYYRNREMKRWVHDVVHRVSPEVTLVYSSSMATYAFEQSTAGNVLLDFIDMDSAKWAEYGRRQSLPMSLIYSREGRLLAHYERQIAAKALRSYFVAEHERALFLKAAPEMTPRVRALGNGVDSWHFNPSLGLNNPFGSEEQAIVFTGAMDYWPNADAVIWFAREMLPSLVERHPGVRFHIVGRGPTDAVRALAGPNVNVTGAVPDVRPYQRHAAVVVAPMRLARGIQNKVLEGMAMGRPVVAATTCVEALDLGPHDGVMAAEEPEDYISAISSLLSDSGQPRARELGIRARQVVLERFSWDSQFALLDEDVALCLESRGKA